MEILKLDTSEGSRNLITEFLTNNEYLLPDRLSVHVKICQYSEKLNRLGSTFVCKINENVCGMVTGYINEYDPLRAYLQVLIVTDSYQGLGIGHKLVQAFLSASKEYGKNEVILTCDKCNTHAESFYIREGFEISSTNHSNPLKQYMIYRF